MIDFFDESGNYLNFYSFMKSEEIIMHQWEDDNEIINMTEEELVNKFSLYAMHTNDEIFEAFEAQDGDKNEYLKELIDIAMYTASAAGFLKTKALHVYQAYEYDIFDRIIYNKSFLGYRIPISNTQFKNLSMEHSEVMLKYAQIRQNFPQRKWHKRNHKFNDDEYREVLSFAYYDLTMLVFDEISFACKEADYDIDLINTLINEKQKKIIDDAKLTGIHDASNLNYQKLLTLEEAVNCDDLVNLLPEQKIIDLINEEPLDKKDYGRTTTTYFMKFSDEDDE